MRSLPTVGVPSRAAAFALLAVGAIACGQRGDSGDIALDSASVAAIERFAKTISADVHTDGVGSIVAGVVDAGNVIWSAAFGLSDRDSGKDADPEGIYRTGSISKTFTAVLLMQLSERGVVGLDDNVVDHLPEFSGIVGPSNEVNSITLRQLASHTSGLVREPELVDAAAGPIAEWEEKILASIPTTSLQSDPGFEYSYSNIGFGILGLALSRAAGASFMDLIGRMTFEPLGMESSTFVIGPELEPRLSVGYQNHEDGTITSDFPSLEHAGRGYKVPNGGIYSTVADLGRFIGGLTGTSVVEILDEHSIAEMQRRQTPAEGRGYGLGLAITVSDNGPTLLGHGGSVSGYTAHMKFEPETGLGVVLLRNYGSGETNLGDAATGLLEVLVAARRERVSNGR